MLILLLALLALVFAGLATGGVPSGRVNLLAASVFCGWLALFIALGVLPGK
jgi:hypothetical protein